MNCWSDLVVTGSAGLKYFRKTKAIGHILEHGSLPIQDFEGLCPDINRRTLQRELKAMMDRGLIVSEGITHQLRYRLTVYTCSSAIISSNASWKLL